MDFAYLLPYATTDTQRTTIQAVIAHGGIRPAARHLGRDRKTVFEVVQVLRSRAHASGKPNVESLPSAELARLQQQLQEEKRKVEAYKLLVEEQEKLVADFQASRFDIPRQKIAQFQAKGSYVRVAYGDTHGSSLDQMAWAAFLQDLRLLKPKETIHLGDIVECGGWLAAHHTTNYVAQTEYTYSDDIIAANIGLDDVQDAIGPNADLHIIEGNHDARIATWAITMAQKKRADVEFLIDRLGPRALLSIDKRKIHWWSRGDVHKGSVVGGTLKLGKCFFTHPQTSSKHHASATAAKFGHNVVYGHTHRADFYPGGDVEGREWAAWSPGCLCKLRKYWHHTEPFRHNHGYHVQLVKSDGTFLGINVPIINGKSYLSGLLKLSTGI